MQTHELMMYSLDTLLCLLREEAWKTHRGHYAIFAFGGGYKVAMGTPNLFTLLSAEAQLRQLPSFSQLRDALLHALIHSTSFDDYDVDGIAWMERELKDTLHTMWQAEYDAQETTP